MLKHASYAPSTPHTFSVGPRPNSQPFPALSRCRPPFHDVVTSTMEDACSIFVLGASGDLALKKTYPSLFELYLAGLLPARLAVFGYARSAMTDADFQAKLRNALKGGSDEQRSAFLAMCFYRHGGYGDADAFRVVRRRGCGRKRNPLLFSSLRGRDPAAGTHAEPRAQTYPPFHRCQRRLQASRRARAPRARPIAFFISPSLRPCSSPPPRPLTPLARCVLPLSSCVCHTLWGMCCL